MKYVVKAEFVDRHTGKRYFPAEVGQDPVIFEPADEGQAKALAGARCIDETPVTVSLFEKQIADLTRSELEALSLAAANEGIAAASDDDLRSGIEAYQRHVIERDEKSLDKLSVEQLKSVAEAENVELDGATRKADIIAAIKLKREAA